MVNKVIRFLLVSSFVFVLLTPSAKAQTDSDVPYLYYYAIEEQAFVIEQANGENRHILAPYSVPPENVILDDGTGYIIGPGWSPSGEWFAWSSLLRNGASGKETLIIYRDGSSLIQLTDSFIINELQWSPYEDLLLRWYSPENSEDADQIIEVYDPQTAQTVFSLSAKYLFDSTAYIRQVDWTPDGQHIFVINDKSLKIISRAGTVVKSFETTRIPSSSCYGTLPYWLDGEHLAYVQLETTSLIVENIKTQEYEKIMDLSPDTVQMVDWSPDHTYAFIYTESPDHSGYKLWLLSLVEGEISLISDSIYFSSPCAILFNSTLWISDHQAIYFSEDKQIQVFNASTFNTTAIEMPTDSELATVSPLRWTDTGEIVFLVRHVSSAQFHVYEYNLTSNRITLLAPISPDASVYADYISTIQERRLVHGGSVINTVDGTQLNILHTPPELGSLEFNAQHVEWHDSGN